MTLHDRARSSLTRRLLAWAFSFAASAIALPATAETALPPSASPETPLDETASPWGERHPFALGVRLLGRAGDGYAMGGLGGHLRFRPFSWLRVELFADHFLGADSKAIRHDHEIGGTVQIPVYRAAGLVMYPMLGACAMLAVLDPKGETPSVSDVRFGVHVGAGAELALGKGFSLQAQLEGIGYLGRELQAYNFSARVGRDLQTTFAGQAMVGLDYWF